MKSFPTIVNNNARLDALHSYRILDSLIDEEFDELTALASTICNVPIALISLVDKNRQWFKSHHGLDTRETPIEQSFCAHAIINQHEPFLVEDATIDERFRDNPLVTGEPNIVFYLGVPLVNEAGYALGTLCIIDHEKKTLNESQLKSLKILAKQVMDKLELKRKIFQLENANQDIKVLNERVRLSQQQAIHLIDDAPVGIAYLDSRNLVIATANRQILEIWGKGSEVIGQTLASALPELQNQPFLQILDNVFTTGIAYAGFEVKANIHRPSGNGNFYFNFVYHPVKTENGQSVGIMVVATEVTEQILAREKAAESKQRLAQMVTSSPIGMTILKSRAFIVEIANDPMFKIWGRTEDQIIGKKILEIFPELVDQPFPTLLNQIFDTGKPISLIGVPVEINQNAQPSKNIWVDFTYTPLFDIKGNVEAIMATVLDVTERVKDEYRKNNFIGIVSHEMKTPLTSLKGYLQIVNKHARKVSDDLTNTITEKALLQIDKMNTLVTSFLDIARTDSGKINLNLTLFDINEVLVEMVNELHYQTMSHNIRLKSNSGSLIFADKEKIAQVVTNLLSNAIKYSPLNKDIDLELSIGNENIMISVTDRGLGISENDQKQLFNRFFRVQHNDNKGISGFGIGLYLCSEIIKHHSGNIGVSSSLGKGSTFWFSLPIATSSN